jgi:ABC-2 type transport system ATP-binding protein
LEIELEGVTKHFGSTIAVDDVNLRLTGRVNLLLGSNGSGKSTLINLLAGITYPNKGILRFEGSEYNAKSKKSWRIGTERLRKKARFWLDKPGLPLSLSGRDLLKFESGQTGKKSKDEGHNLEEVVQNSFGSSVDLDKPISSYSSGMQQKLGIMATLIGEPQIVVWDEPTATLDATSRAIVARLAKEYSSQGTIFLIASHIAGDFEEAADWVGLMRLGQLVKSGNLSELSNTQMHSRDYVISTDRPSQIASRLIDLGLASSVSVDSQRSLISLKAAGDFAMKDVAEIANQAGASYATIRKREMSITELYLEALA